MNPLRTFICWLFHREDHAFVLVFKNGVQKWECARCDRAWFEFPETKADEGGW